MEENKKPENPSAFPLDANSNHLKDCRGMTLRDYFAAKALNGILSENGYPKVTEEFQSLCKMSFMIADEMLKQRELEIPD